MKNSILAILISLSFYSFAQSSEPHLKNIKQLTHGGDNAEAYFSPNGKFVSFQSNNAKWGLHCDQIFAMNLKKAAKDSAYMPTLISTGKGRTTCSYYMPDMKHILFASTHLAADTCPPTAYLKGRYLWDVYAEYDIFVADLKGNITKQLTTTKGYDAEATISPKGDKIVFTSDRSGDLELWTMNIDGTDQKQVTFGLGYDGGAFFSPDGKKLVFRASRPQTDEEIKDYKGFLSQHLVAPVNMEIYTCNVDGSDLKQITHLGKANWAPYFLPSGDRIIFSSNHQSAKGYDFQLFVINIDGSGLTQVTSGSNFNAFPMFAPNGKKLIFSSNRNNKGRKGIDLYIADWVD